MNMPPLFKVLASAALLSTPLHAQLYTLHGDGVKKTERVVEKADYSDYELVWHDEFDKDGRPDPAKWNYEHGFVRNKEAQWYQSENACCKEGKTCQSPLRSGGEKLADDAEGGGIHLCLPDDARQIFLVVRAV